MLPLTPKDELIELESELDARVANSPLIRLPARTNLVCAHHVLDDLAHGNRMQRTPGNAAAAEAYAGRLFGLAPVLERASNDLVPQPAHGLAVALQVVVHGASVPPDRRDLMAISAP